VPLLCSSDMVESINVRFGQLVTCTNRMVAVGLNVKLSIKVSVRVSDRFSVC